MANLSIQKGLALGIRDDLRQASVLATLNTSGGTLVADSIQERLVPSLRDFVSDTPGSGQHQLPGILIVHPAIGETFGIEDNVNDQWGFPILIAVAAATEQSPDAPDRYLFWRETIIARYITRRFTISDPVAAFHTCRIEPGPVADWDRWAKDGKFASWFVLRFFLKRQRPVS